jgi:hypothetical protein
VRLIGTPFQRERAPFRRFIVTRAIERMAGGRMG